MRANTRRGFTLMELLVVISIIAVLSVISIAAFSTAQAVARDGKRRSEVASLAKALEANRNFSTGQYRYTKNDFKADLPTIATGDDTRYLYCVGFSTTSRTPPSPSGVDEVFSNDQCEDGNSWYPAREGDGEIFVNSPCNSNVFCEGTVLAWTVCVRLEREGLFCMSSIGS